MTSAQLESIDCNLCGTGSALSTLYDFDPFKIVRCGQCGLVFVNPRLTESAALRLYQNSYFENPSFFSGDKEKVYGYSNYEENRPDIEKMYRKVLREIEQLKKNGALLEIGSAYGYFLNIARQGGWDVSGIELSAKAADYSQRHFGITPFIGSLNQFAGAQKRTFDVVAFFDVLEHLHAPLQALQSIHAMLNPDGIIAFAVPNSAPWVFKMLGSQWEDLQKARANEHLYFFSAETIKKFLDKCGFETIAIKSIGRFFSLKHLCDRLTIYNEPVFRLAGRVAGFLGLSETSVYVNPGLKIIIYARKTDPEKKRAPQD